MGYSNLTAVSVSTDAEGRPAVQIHFTEGAIQPDGNCTRNYKVALPSTDSTYDSVLSVAMAAFLAGKKVKIWYESAQCAADGAPIIQAIKIAP